MRHRKGVTPDELLNGPGCAWWSADTLDKKGNGMCLSWGFGHPMARRGDVSAPARDIGSLELLVFAQGVCSLWLHQRFVGDDTFWRGSMFRFGRSQIEMLQDMRARIAIGRLDMQLPRGETLEATIEVAATPSEGTEALWESTSLLCGPGKGQGAVTAHGRPFTVIGDGTLVRRTFASSDHIGTDLIALQREHTVLVCSALTDDGWGTEAASINRQGHVSPRRPFAVDNDALTQFVEGHVPEHEVKVEHEGDLAFDLRDFRAVHPAGSPVSHFQAQVYAPMEIARPCMLRTWSGAPSSSDAFVLDANGTGPKHARLVAGAQGRKPGWLERMFA